MNHVMRIVPNDVKRQLASYRDPQLPWRPNWALESSVY
jgi:hypothetical protein